MAKGRGRRGGAPGRAGAGLPRLRTTALDAAPPGREIVDNMVDCASGEGAGSIVFGGGVDKGWGKTEADC